jgi:RNA polymerase sigma factor (sigma-70 family)
MTTAAEARSKSLAQFDAMHVFGRVLASRRAHASMSDSSVLDELVTLYGRDLLRFLTHRVGWQDAPDLVQETFLRVLRHGEAGAVAEPRAFLRTTALNLARDHLRRRRTERKHVARGPLPLEIAASDLSAEETMAAAERMQRLEAAVAALPSRCRELFLLRRQENLGQDEIARRLKISRNMVEKHLRLALARCRAAID